MNRSSSWRVAHASAIGRAHLNQNTECQDRFACRASETAAAGEVFVAVVADGAGSTTDGGRGAELACALFIEEVAAFLNSKDVSVKALNEDFGKRWIDYFQQKIAAVAAADGKTMRDFATTLVGAVIGENGAALYQIGDGGIVVADGGETKSYRFGIEPAESLYVNMTDFVTDETAGERMRFKFIEEAIEDLILFSDGIFAVAVDYQTNQPHAPFLAPMLAPLRNGGNLEGLNEKLEKFLASAKINEKTDDDKTIILAARRAPQKAEIPAEKAFVSG